MERDANILSFPISIEKKEDDDSGHQVVFVKDSKGRVIISETGIVDHDLLNQLIQKVNL